MIGAVATFVAVCLATSFVCTAVKEDEDRRLGTQTGRLLGVMTGGILLFGVVVQLLTLWAG